MKEYSVIHVTQEEAIKLLNKYVSRKTGKEVEGSEWDESEGAFVFKTVSKEVGAEEESSE
jgi:hypothetical protein